MIHVQVYRYNPEVDNAPRMQSYQVEDKFRQQMVLDVLEHLKERDSSLAYRRSCREGVCGSDGMNINGQNALACITSVSEILAGIWTASCTRGVAIPSWASLSTSRATQCLRT